MPPGVTVFDAACWNGVAIDSTCGGHGTCKKCRVRDRGRRRCRLASSTCAPSRRDELRDGWRLACRAQARRISTSTCRRWRRGRKAATVGVGRQVILRPALLKRYLELEEATLEDQRSDPSAMLRRDGRPRAARRAGRAARLPPHAARADFKVTAVVVDDLLVDVEPGDTSGRRYAIAFDLGTTTVVATLLDLATGTPVAMPRCSTASSPSAPT